MLKFCKDCIFFRNAQQPKCYHPVAEVDTDLIFGHKIYATAEFMRANTCGREAKLYSDVRQFPK
jgi:hypothetical protein